MKAWHATILLFLAFVATWCMADWVYVRASQGGKKEIHRAEWVFLVFPLTAGVVVLKRKKEVSPVSRILLSLGTSIVFGAVCVVWVLYFGIPFHFWLGGGL